MTVEGCASKLDAIVANIPTYAVGEAVELTVSPRTHGTVAELTTALVAASRGYQAIDAALMQQEVEWRDRGNRLKNADSNFRRASEALQKLQELNPEILESELKSLDAELERAEAELNSASSASLTLHPICERLIAIDSEITAAANRIGDAEVANPGGRMQDVEDRLTAARRAMEEQFIERLVAEAAKYLKRNETAECPICGQPMEFARTLARIDGLLAGGSELSRRLAGEIDALSLERVAIASEAEALARDRALVTRGQESRARLISQLVEEKFDAGDGSVSAVASLQQSFEIREREALARRNEVDGQLSQLRLEKPPWMLPARIAPGPSISLSALLGVQVSPNHVASAIETALEDVQTKLQHFADSRRRLLESQESLNLTREVVAYLREVDDVEELAHQVPPCEDA